MSARRSRLTGCRHCGSREHYTKTHFGTLKREHAIYQVSARRDPLGIARSSWVVNDIKPRARREAAA